MAGTEWWLCLPGFFYTVFVDWMGGVIFSLVYLRVGLGRVFYGYCIYFGVFGVWTAGIVASHV